MDREIYLHAINSVPDDYYHPDETNKTLLQILKRRALLSSKLQRRRSTGGFNGRDYVSLCDYDKRNDYKKFMGKYNAFHTYVRYSLSLAFPKDKLDVIEPKVLNGVYIRDSKGYAEMEKIGKSKSERCTDMPDEVQVKDKVSLDNLCATTFPLHLLKGYGNSSIDELSSIIMFEIEEIDKLLSRFGYDVPIYDIDTFEELTSTSKIKMILRNK